MAASITSFDTLIGSARDALFEWFDLIDATNVSSVNKQTRLDVSEHLWGWDAVRAEYGPLVGGQPGGGQPGGGQPGGRFRKARPPEPTIVNLSNWRKCFPKAVSAKLSQHTIFGTNDLSNLKGVRWLDQNSNRSVSDSMFDHIGPTVSNLRLENCDLITDSAFLQLKQIRRLTLINCRQITDCAFLTSCNIRSLQILHICSCSKITDLAFSNLQTVRGLSLVDLQVTDRALIGLAELQILCILDCPNIRLFGGGPLAGPLAGVPFGEPPGGALAGVPFGRNLHTVMLDDCPNLTDSSFRYISNVDTLILNNCNQITGEGFRFIRNIQTLRVFACPITDQAFSGIGKTLKELVLRFCDRITNEAFRSFSLFTELEEVNIQRCSQVSGSVVEHLHRVSRVKLNLSDT